MDLYREFSDAAARDDFEGMLAAYEKTWEETDADLRDLRTVMSRDLMNRCPLPGVRKVGENTFVQHFGHSPDQDGPDRILAAYPAEAIRTGNRFLDSPYCKSGQCWWDSEEIIRWFYTCSPEFGRPSTALKSCIWDKKEGRLTESVIPLELDEGTFVRRVIGISSLGHLLLLELRFLQADEKKADRFLVTCYTTHGRRVGTVLEGEGDQAPEGCLLEDGVHGPHRGYLWVPNTSRVWYFEMDGDEFYARPWEETRPSEGRAFPMPEKLFYEEKGPSYRRTGETVKSLLLSVDGFGMALITSHKGLMTAAEASRPFEGRSLLIYLKSQGRWERVEFGEPRTFFLTRDLAFFMEGKRANGSTDHIFRLYPSAMEHKQRPLFTMRCPIAGAGIRAFSGDLNALCDGRGFPLYDLCWKFHKGKEGGKQP